MKPAVFDRGKKFGLVYDELLRRPRVTEVYRDEYLSFDGFRSASTQSRPVIYRNEGVSPPDVMQMITAGFGDIKVRVRTGDYVSPNSYLPENRRINEMRLRDYLSSMSQPLFNGDILAPPPYAGNFTLPVNFLSTIGAPVPKWYEAENFEPPTVWIGPKGSITPLHRDSSDNFIYQLKGRKRWVLFSPLDAPFLYFKTNSASVGGDFAPSEVDLRFPDLNRFPLFLQAQPLTFELSAGDILYLPMGWGHFVENLTDSLMVNYWISANAMLPGVLQDSFEQV